MIWNCCDPSFFYIYLKGECCFLPLFVCELFWFCEVGLEGCYPLKYRRWWLHWSAKYLVRDSLDLFVGGVVGIPYIDVFNPLLLSRTFSFSFLFFINICLCLRNHAPKLISLIHYFSTYIISVNNVLEEDIQIFCDQFLVDLHNYYNINIIINHRACLNYRLILTYLILFKLG